MFSLANKTIVVTGAGSGIGKAVALLLAEQGATIIVTDLDKQSAAITENEIIHNGGTATFLTFNVANQQEVLESFSQIETIDVLITCAGISNIGNAENTSEADFDRVFNVNVKGTYNCIHAAIPIMKRNGGGLIITISSVAAKVGLQDRFAYSMSKGAVHSMTLSVAKDYIKDNIRCNTVSPARIHTPFVDGFLSKNYAGREDEMFDKLSKSQPIGRMGQPNEVAAMIAYLCSDQASFLTGSDYAVDGGFITLNT
jgi:NAD(P)-dependent dehydrogenase (short-subunit alcohol dehydrogenase family)